MPDLGCTGSLGATPPPSALHPVGPTKWRQRSAAGPKGVGHPRQPGGSPAGCALGVAGHWEGLVSSCLAPDPQPSMGRRSQRGLPLDPPWGSGPHHPADRPLLLPGAPRPQGHHRARGPSVQESHQGGHPLRPRLPGAVVSGSCGSRPLTLLTLGSGQTSPLTSEFTSIITHGVGPGSNAVSFYISLGRFL